MRVFYLVTMLLPSTLFGLGLTSLHAGNRVQTIYTRDMLIPGDTIHVSAGCANRTIILRDISGTGANPIVIRGENRQNSILDAEGFEAGIVLENCSHIRIENLTITADGGGVTETAPVDMRCGILVLANTCRKFEDITISDVTIHDVYYEDKGFVRNENDRLSENGKMKYGWGIRFLINADGGALKNITVRNCRISDVSHTGIRFTGNKGRIKNVRVIDNKLSRTGGPGIQLSCVVNGLCEGNTIDCSGSRSDSRKWGRGSGLWTWSCSKVIVERNTFSNARGPGDSAGVHIDFNCSDVIVQYNLSMHNEGGFCQILGNNYNCCYRFNVSVNDGYRKKGEEDAFMDGPIVHISGYMGKQKRTGPYNSYVYNNTVFVDDGQYVSFAFDRTLRGVLIANNIFCIRPKAHVAPQLFYSTAEYSPEMLESLHISNNIFLHENSWPYPSLFNKNTIVGDPMFINPGGTDISDYIPQNAEIISHGMKIRRLPRDSKGVFNGLYVRTDILGNILDTPIIGAIKPK